MNVCNTQKTRMGFPDNMKGWTYKNISELGPFGAMLIFVLSLPFSESLISISAALLLFFQILFLIFRIIHKQPLFPDKTIFLLPSITMVYVIGLLGTHNISMGLYEINKSLFWVLLSLGVAMVPKLPEKRFWLVLAIFIAGVLLSSWISFGKMLIYSNIKFDDFRQVNFVSHIPFSFQITLCILILLYSFVYPVAYLSRINKGLRVFAVVWFIAFLLMLKSMLGLVVFYVLVVISFIYILRTKRTGIKSWFSILILSVLIIPVVYTGYVAINFYSIKDKKEDTIHAITARGNSYHFNFSDKSKENGHYISWYVCEDELKAAWDKRSKLKYNDKAGNGFSVSSTLIRYLTSKGLKKDAEGVAALTQRDVENIEKGIANYIYDSPVYAVYPRIYETIWELDQYFLNGNPNNQSLSQRIEYAKAAIHIIRNHSIIGIGTGNYKQEFKKAFVEINSNLDPQNYGTAHNQYLSYLLKFGVIGFLYILFVIFFLIRKKRQYKNELFMLFLIQFLLANFGDSNWETHVGLAYFVFFYTLFLWHSPEKISKPLVLRSK